jgi:hypothetical protein
MSSIACHVSTPMILHQAVIAVAAISLKCLLSMIASIWRRFDRIAG